MNDYDMGKSSSAKLLEKYDGRIILRIQFRSLITASIIGPLFGLYFIYTSLNLSILHFIQLIGFVYIFTLLVDVLHLLYTAFITRNARSLLSSIHENSPINESGMNLQAWDEIIYLPKRSAIIRLFLIFILVFSPVVYLLYISVGLTLSQIGLIFIGGALSAFADIILAYLFLDSHLGVIRHAFLPKDPALQGIRSRIDQPYRQYFILIYLLIATILTVGAANIQRFQSMDSFGGNPSEFLSQYQTHLAVMAVAILGLSSFLISRMVQAQTMSENEIGETLEKAVSGDFSNRAKITSSTELAQAAIDLNQLLDRMETAQSSANEKIQERTNELEQKNRKLLVAALVAREASSEQNIDSLLNRIVDLISERFGFYHAAVFLVDDIGENVILRAASSEGGKRMLEKGHQLKIGQQGIVGAAAYQNKAQIVFDVLSEINYYKNPELPMTRSEAAFPLFARGKVIGILDIQSNEQLALVQSDMEIIQILADQLGMVIQNTQLLSESQEAIKKLESMSQRDLRLAWQERLHGRKQSYRYTSKGFTIKSQGGSNETARDLSNKQISAPIKLRGQLLGNISLLRKTGSSWGEADRAMVSKIALQVGLALENVRLLNEAQRHASQEQALSDLTSRISQFLDPDIIMQNAIRELHHLPNVEEVSLFISPAITESNTTGNGA